MTKIPIAVVGAGHLGRIHARLSQQHPDAHLVAIVDPDPAARQLASESLGVAAVDHHHELIGQIEAAIIATTTTQHYTVCRDLVQQGVHLLVEKPFTGNLAQADEILALAERQQTLIQVGHVERYNPAFTAARPYLDQPYYLEGVRTSSYTCRSTDIGVVLDLMIHDLDIALSLVASPIVDIRASGAIVIGPHEDLAEARITFANGCVANFTASRVSQDAQRHLQVFSREAFASVDFGKKTAKLIRPSSRLLRGIDVHWLDRDQREHLKDHLFEDYLPASDLPVADRNALLDEQRDFIASIRTGRPPRVSGRSAREVLRVAAYIQDEITRYVRRFTQRTVPLESLPLPNDAAPVPRRIAG